MTFYYNGVLDGEGSGSIPDPAVYGGRQLAVVKPSTAHLPSSPSDLVKNNYVIVDRNLDDSVFPFTIDSVTFLSKYDSAIYNGSQWELQSGIQNTLSVRVIDRANESLSGNATTQQEANIEFTNEIKDLKTRSFRTIGYCGTTQPLQAREDDIFYQTNATSSYGSDLPTNFPIQVYRWNNGAWSANTENWTPDVNDVIINININPPIAFVWQNGWSPTTQGLSTTDNLSIDRNNNGELQVKDSGITFPKLDPNAIATQNENSNNKVVRADAMYNTAITKNVSQIKAKTGGGKEIEIDLQNEANVSKTKVNIDLDETATQNSNNPITSNGVWKEELNNTNSSQTCSYDTTSKKLQLTTQLKNNNNDLKVNKTTNLISKGTDYVSLSDTDKLSSFNITTQELKDVALSAVNTYIQNKLNGAISTVLTNNLTANRAVITNASGKLAVADAVTAKTNTNLAGVSYNAQGVITGKGTEYSVQTSMPSSPTDSQFLTAKAVYDGFAPRQTTYISGEYSVFIDANDAVFNFPTTTPNTRAVDKMQFLVTFTDPISNATAWGDCETRIIVNNYDGESAGIEVHQTVICMGNTSKFYRKGTLNPAQDITKIYENRSNIVWLAWYPVDHPQINLSTLLNTTDFSGGYIVLTITGGVAMFELENIEPRSTNVKDIIVSTNFSKYSKFFKSNARATLGNARNPLNGGTLTVRANRNSSLTCIAAGTANNNYNGQLVATLGY